ncbi:MAG TPA: flavin-dependent oxidoreductase [Steroidobacteraceae bacterium]|nr:flavin-dependent oxidoreductase [Steroidobacteraceae bacterium]
MSLPILIAGGGIGGLATALLLHARGLSVQVFERVPALRPLGVGINLLPHAARVAHELGLASRLAATAIQTGKLEYYNKFGQLIWSEPRGLAAGYSVPQYSIHRGDLQMLLYEAAIERLGRERIQTDATFEGVEHTDDHVIAQFKRGDGSTFEAQGSALIAADGIHSVLRRSFYPNEGEPNFAQRILWRAVSEGQPFLDGRTMIMAGFQHEKFVCYPISQRHAREDRALINWIAELTVPEKSPPKQDWNREVPKSRFAARFANWRFPWLDVPALIESAREVYEFPLVDRDPLPTWTRGRVTLLGDAAHPMYPIGSNGASQAILDAESLANAMAKLPVTEALQTYEAERRPATAKLVLLNRQNGPEQVMQMAEERAPNGFTHIHDVIPQTELEEISLRYKQTAGFTVSQVNQKAAASA